MKAKFMRVVVMSKDGKYISTYEGISRIAPSFNGDKVFLTKELTAEEMELYKRDPNEDEDYITCTIEDAKEVNLIVTMM